MMADSSQIPILERLMVSSCILAGGCRVRFDEQTLLTLFDRRRFGLRMIWDAARSFCLLCFSFAASCLSTSNLRLTFLTDERQLSRSEASCCCHLKVPSCFDMERQVIHARPIREKSNFRQIKVKKYNHDAHAFHAKEDRKKRVE